MWDAFANGPEVPGTGRTRLRLYLAELDGEALAAAIVVRVGTHATYTYGASTAARRDARAANALQWRAMTDALNEGCTVYDFRGISSTLDGDSPLAGLLRFKLGAGGEVTRYVGEWELTLSTVWHTALRAYLRLRS
jgi:lipid II:glycine glycyltransferase (peptidoglycan interpeptide bridge formation enzyme)